MNVSKSIRLTEIIFIFSSQQTYFTHLFTTLCTCINTFEFKTLAEDPLLADTKGRLEAALFAWMEQQNDHLSEYGAITLFAVKKHSLNQTEKQFNYVVPEEHSGPVAGLVDPHASTQPNP